MSFPPQLYLIGTQKGGTSFLAELLAEHPDVCLARPKEPNFFSSHWEKGLEHYRTQFARPDAKVLLDASTSYAAAPLESTDTTAAIAASRFAGVPARIAAASPKARFVYVIRDPVRRAWSSYWHTVRVGAEDRPLGRAIRENSFFLRTGRYLEQLQLYWKLFPRDRFRVLLFEDLVADPARHANDILHFAGLTPVSAFTSERPRNQTFAYTPGAARLVRMIRSAGGRSDRLIKAVKPLLPRKVIDRIAGRIVRPVPPLGPEDEAYMRDYFRTPNRRLADELGLDLSRWGAARPMAALSQNAQRIEQDG
jgi:hypothetical protein